MKKNNIALNAIIFFDTYLILNPQFKNFITQLTLQTSYPGLGQFSGPPCHFTFGQALEQYSDTLY